MKEPQAVPVVAPDRQGEAEAAAPRRGRLQPCLVLALLLTSFLGLELLLPLGGSWSVLESLPELVSPDPDPAQLADRHEIRDALALLPEPYGSTLIIVYLEGSTETELAQHSVLTQSAISKRMSAGLKRLRRWCDTGDCHQAAGQL
jgi:DNA-directed RNA polymerase specialized sigma24 family protein